MGGYLDFRLVMSPDLANPGQWQVTVEDCPLPGLIGPKGSVDPVVTRTELNLLRDRDGWPNLANLRRIGKAVWQSMMLPGAEAAFEGSLEIARQHKKRLRLVLTLQGEDNPPAGTSSAIRLSELPVEAIYSEKWHFLATDRNTPISRSFQQRPDRDPQHVVPPLRVLVAVAAPIDKPPAEAAHEAETIRKAVAPLTKPGGPLEVDFIEEATRTDVLEKLTTEPYRVLHFIGHGGFDIVGNVEAPRAHLCFLRADGTRHSHPTDADTLTTMLKNTSVSLAVITACSSAAPTPPTPNDPIDAGPLGTGAFEGVAQRLVTGESPVIAAVGMQFDLEDEAAVEFSSTFYKNLLRPDVALDEVVTLARQALVTKLEAGHRAWVTPAVYWRCIDGRVFDVATQREDIDERTLTQLQDIDTRLGIYRAQIVKIVAKPPEERTALRPIWLDNINDIEILQAQRAELSSESLRMCGSHAIPGQEVRCRMSLRLRYTGIVSLIRFDVEYPAEAISFARADSGAAVAEPPLTDTSSPGVVRVALDNPSGGRQWAPEEYELAFLRFVVADSVQPSLLDVRIIAPHATRDGQRVDLGSVNGTVFVEEIPAAGEPVAGEAGPDGGQPHGVAQREPLPTVGVIVPTGVGSEIDTDVLVDALNRLEILRPAVASLHERIDAAIEAHRPGEDWQLRLEGPLNRLRVYRESLEELKRMPQRWVHAGRWSFTFNDALRDAICAAGKLETAITERYDQRLSSLNPSDAAAQFEVCVDGLTELINGQR